MPHTQWNSLHARRIPRVAVTRATQLGTTSAYAENTLPRWRFPQRLWNYLRVRGEYRFSGIPEGKILELPPRTRRIQPCRCDAGHVLELPPRTRRIHCQQSLSQAPLGTTSAYAENTPCDTEIIQPRWNYLRVRGEYQRRGLTLAWDRGTTSAYAENTPQPCADSPHQRNYLRVRGEYPNELGIL